MLMGKKKYVLLVTGEGGDWLERTWEKHKRTFGGWEVLYLLSGGDHTHLNLQKDKKSE